jgi:signal peptidase I
MEERPRNDGLFSFLGDMAKVIILSLIIILPIRYFIAQPFFVRGASMEPVYDNGDYLLVDEVSYRFSDPERGEVVIFRFPGDSSQFYIKRIIGLPGEQIAIGNGVITVTNSEHPEGFVLREDYLTKDTAGEVSIRLGENEFFVLGDNRDASYDSRAWGVLPRSNIVGRAFLRAWPFNRAGILENPNYETAGNN